MNPAGNFQWLTQTPAPTDPLAFVQYGFLGVILIMLLTGWLWAKPAVDDMQKRHSEQRALWEERILPTMDKLSRDLERLTEQLSRRVP